MWLRRAGPRLRDSPASSCRTGVQACKVSELARRLADDGGLEYRSDTRAPVSLMGRCRCRMALVWSAFDGFGWYLVCSSHGSKHRRSRKVSVRVTLLIEESIEAANRPSNMNLSMNWHSLNFHSHPTYLSIDEYTQLPSSVCQLCLVSSPIHDHSCWGWWRRAAEYADASWKIRCSLASLDFSREHCVEPPTLSDSMDTASSRNYISS